MIIGIDFDNTIVCYDGVFHRLASERRLIPSATAPTKTAVRDAMRQAGREDEWTELQAEVYGPRILEAVPFPGFLRFIRFARAAEVELHIVSHKTRRPVTGAAHDLHGWARRWLAHYGCEGDRRDSLSFRGVHFARSREAKFEQIAALHCQVFIDDLPEFLLSSSFPSGVNRLLFDPHGEHKSAEKLIRVRCWSDLSDMLVASGVAQ